MRMLIAIYLSIATACAAEATSPNPNQMSIENELKLYLQIGTLEYEAIKWECDYEGNQLVATGTITAKDDTEATSLFVRALTAIGFTHTQGKKLSSNLDSARIDLVINEKKRRIAIPFDVAIAVYTDLEPPTHVRGKLSESTIQKVYDLLVPPKHFKKGGGGQIAGRAFYVGAEGQFNHRAEVSQVIGEGDMLVTVTGTKSYRFWIHGFPTRGLADGSQVPTDYVWRCTGTKTYGTAIGGTSTVFVLEPIEEETK